MYQGPLLWSLNVHTQVFRSRNIAFTSPVDLYSETNRYVQQNQNLFSLQKLFSFMKTCHILFNTMKAQILMIKKMEIIMYVVVQVEPSFLPNAIEEILLLK